MTILVSIMAGAIISIAGQILRASTFNIMFGCCVAGAFIGYFVR